MTKNIVPSGNNQLLDDITGLTKVCEALLATPHYKKMGSEGVFAIVQKARALNVNTLEALNGGLYYINGKVEMSAVMMNQLIRQAGHSITKDKRSDDTVCILHGKRKDNGDTWSESFSLDDARKAGIYRNQWEKYPRAMLFARALSMLARQLFPDVIKGCYVEGELETPPVQSEDNTQNLEEIEVKQVESSTISEKEALELEQLLQCDSKYQQIVFKFIKKELNKDTLVGIPREVYEKILPIALKKSQEAYGEQQQIAV